MMWKCNHESGTTSLSHRKFKIVNIISNPLLDIFFKNVIEIESSSIEGELHNFRDTDNSTRLRTEIKVGYNREELGIYFFVIGDVWRSNLIATHRETFFIIGHRVM